MAKLVIVESPAKAKTIGKYLGDDYEVTASMGHIRDLPASQLGIDVEHGYTPQYISIKGKEKLIKELKSKAKHADGVLLAANSSCWTLRASPREMPDDKLSLAAEGLA